MPISVLSAIKEASEYDITVKGGKYLEAVAEAEDELLRQAACLEEHFPHSVARAVVEAASKQGLLHEELHTNV